MSLYSMCVIKLELIRCPRCCRSSCLCRLLRRLYDCEAAEGGGSRWWRCCGLCRILPNSCSSLVSQSSWNDGRSRWQNPHFLLSPKNASIHCSSRLLANPDEALLTYIILASVTDLKTVCSAITVNTKNSHHTLWFQNIIHTNSYLCKLCKPK